MQRTSRTPRATRVASAPCPGSPSPLLPSPASLLCLGLLVGAALTALWLLGGAPAHADTDTVGALPSADGSVPLDGVVPGEVAEPVTTTLGTVHQRLQDGPDRHAEPGAALSGAARPVADVGAEVIGAVGEADRALPETADLEAVPVLPLDEPRRPADASGTGDAGATGTATDVSEPAADPDRSEAADAPERGADTRSGSAAPVAADHAPAADRADGHQDADSAPRPPEAPVGQSAAGSAATTASSPAPTPGIAGYLTSAPVTAPDSVAVRPAPRHHRAAPTAGADDPTVSPD